jgi:hypothetical protein
VLYNIYEKTKPKIKQKKNDEENFDYMKTNKDNLLNILKDDSMGRKLGVDFTAVCKLAQELKVNIQQTAKEISEFYQLPSDETAEWLQHVKWSEGIKKAPEVMSGARRILISAGIISRVIP